MDRTEATGRKALSFARTHAVREWFLPIFVKGIASVEMNLSTKLRDVGLGK